MRKNKLYIKVNNTWREVDLFDDVVIPITLKVTDVREFGSKTSGYSLDFEIPNTNNNAQIFGLNSMIEAYESTFEVGKDYPAYVTNDSLTTFQGQFRLKKIFKKNNGKYIYYVGYLYGGTKNFVDELGNKTLIGNNNPNDDLSFSEYNTPAEEMSLADFAGYLQTKYTDGTGWGLTLIDKTNKAAQPFTSGSQEWYTDECTPYLYAREIFDKIFAKTNYRWTSEFLMGTDFSNYLQDARWADTIGKFDVNSIIYPYMKHNSNLTIDETIYSKVQQLDNVNSRFYAQQSYYSSANWDPETVAGWIMKKTETTVNLNYPSSSYYALDEENVSSSKTSYQFTAPKNGFYHIRVNIPFNVKAKYGRFLSDGQGGYVLDHLITPSDYNSEGMHFWMPSYLPNMEAMKWEFSLTKNGTEIIAQQTKTYNTVNTTFQLSPDYNGTFSYTWDSGVLSYEGDIMLLGGDTINLKTYTQYRIRQQISLLPDSPVIGTTYYVNAAETETITVFPYPMYIEVPAASDETYILEIQNIASFAEDAQFNPTAILNPKTTQLDYFQNFCKAFDLYVEDVSGKTNYKTGEIYPENTLRIEPYQIYYCPELGEGMSNIKDWTQKIDFESVEYRRVDDYLYNIQNFTKAQDGDFYNDDYDKTYILPYGNREVKGIYYTNGETNEIPLKISASVCGVVNNNTDVLQCPKVFGLNNSGEIDTKKEYSDGWFFIWNNNMLANTSAETNYTLKLQSRIYPNSAINLTQYYTSDTLNKGYGNDDANLNWGETSVYYQNTKGTSPTFNDLYNAFYKLEYEEKTAPDARIMRANAYLTALDIYQLQLSDMILINGNTYHILEVIQWKDEKTPCTVELIKCKPNEAPATVRGKFPTYSDVSTLSTTLDNATLLARLQELEATR